jgi:hypothetical protein
MRLCNDNLAVPLQKMIPESARELPSAIARSASISHYLHFSLSRSLLLSFSLWRCVSVANSWLLRSAANHPFAARQTENC